MIKSALSFLTLFAFAIALPLNSWAAVAGGKQDSLAEVGIGLDDAAVAAGVGPVCPEQNSGTVTDETAGGAIASLEETAAIAQATTCCWVYWHGKWWCLSCY